MTALHRVKAYFGMVPVDDLDAYDGYDDDPRDGDDRRGRSLHDDDYDARESRYAHAGGRYERPDRESRVEHRGDRYEPADFRSRTPRPRDPASLPDAESVGRGGSRGRSWAANTGPNHTSVRGLSGSGSRTSASLASVGGGSGASGSMGPVGSVGPSGAAPAGGGAGSGGSAPAATAGPSAPAAPVSSSPGTVGATRGALAVDESRRREISAVEEPVNVPVATRTPAPAEIVTLRPTSYNEARVIGERYRDGIPVIINLTELDDVAAKRLVDFAAGLAFALRGSIEKVTNRVFLLSPPNVEVSAADRRKLAENTLSGSS